MMNITTFNVHVEFCSLSSLLKNLIWTKECKYQEMCEAILIYPLNPPNGKSIQIHVSLCGWMSMISSFYFYKHINTLIYCIINLYKYVLGNVSWGIAGDEFLTLRSHDSYSGNIKISLKCSGLRPDDIRNYMTFTFGYLFTTLITWR